MRTCISRTRWLLTAVVLTAVVLAGGCAAERASTPGPQEPTSPAAPAVVRVHVSGGIAGVSETYEVRAQHPPPDLSAAEVERVLSLADSEAVRDLDGLRQRGPAQCCDLRTFAIAIRHEDGSHTEASLTETDRMPQQLRTLVRLVTQTR